MWRRSDRILWRAVPGCLVLATIDGRTAMVRGSGADVWDLLAEPMSDTAIVDEVAARYRMQVGEITDDVQTLLAGLLDGGYVTRDG